METSQSV